MQLELNRRSKVPMYRQLAAELREQIVSGAMAEGYRLPPERELSSRLEVNRTTVLQAYQQLSRQRHVRAAGCLRKPNIAHVKQ